MPQMARERSTDDRTQLRTYNRSHAVRLEDFDYGADEVMHLVLCAKHSAAWTNDEFARRICEAVLHCSKVLHYDLYGYCLMPDHLHVLLSPATSGIPVARWLQQFKSFSTNLYWRHGGSSKLWQRSAYDHVCRESETAEKVLRYIVENPVRAGLVADWGDWPWTGVFIEI